ncbi:NADPH oxidase activator 1 [Discoglossus pictus]
MPYKDLIKCWHQGVLAAESKDLDLALKIFTGIEDPPSRIWFNIGCIHLMKEDLPNALEAYNKSVSKDSCLAVGFFQRSYVHFKLERYEKALSDCHIALTHLRNNSVIDYKQLGLRHLLYVWEVLYNTAAILSYLERWESAEQKLKEALTWVPGEARNGKIDSALDQVQRRLLPQPVHVPLGEFFRPRKQEVEQLKSKDFLGKPKVISSVVPNDEYSGFEPLRPQKPGFYEPCPESMLGRDAGYHLVLVHYYPENSTEVAVKANSVVFVLDKYGDWATAIHDGQKILIPTNLLEPVNTPKADIKKKNNGIPLPPMKMPPTRPNVKPGVEQLIPLQQGVPVADRKALPPQPTGDPPVPYKLKTFTHRAEPKVEINVSLQSSAPNLYEDRMKQVKAGPEQEGVAPPTLDEDIVLQVNTEITVMMKVRKDITYPELQNMLRAKLRQQGDQMAIQLSYKNPDGKGLTPVQDDGALQGMWQQVEGNRLMLCCKDANRCVGRDILYRVVALYDYPAEGKEDLTFTQGKIIDVLSEVNDEWLEGHCDDKIGIFPKCFVSKLDDNLNAETT